MWKKKNLSLVQGTERQICPSVTVTLGTDLSVRTSHSCQILIGFQFIIDELYQSTMVNYLSVKDGRDKVISHTLHFISGDRCLVQFFWFSKHGAFWVYTNNLDFNKEDFSRKTCKSIAKDIHSPLPWRLHMKFGFDWPISFGEEDL